MVEQSDTQEEDNRVTHASPDHVSPLADVVSLETVVNVLIRKGVCTPDELFEEERKRREYQTNVKDISVVRTESTSKQVDSRQDGKSRRKKQTWLKGKMSQKRWTRRVATSLFGWEWKKVKHEKMNPKTAHLQGEDA